MFSETFIKKNERLVCWLRVSTSILLSARTLWLGPRKCMVLSKSAIMVVILVLSWFVKKLQIVPSSWFSFFVLLLRLLRFFRSLFFLQIFVLKIFEDEESWLNIRDSRDRDCCFIPWRERAGGLRNSVCLQPSNSTRRWSHLPTFCSHALRAVENKKGVVTLILANSSVEITCWIPLLICSVKVYLQT